MAAVWLLPRRCQCGALPSAHAIAAFRDRRIRSKAGILDRLAAIGAKAVFTLFQPVQRRIDTQSFCATPPRMCLCHRLILQSIHPREPANRLLIQLYGLLSVKASGIFGIKRLKPGMQSGFWIHAIW